MINECPSCKITMTKMVIGGTYSGAIECQKCGYCPAVNSDSIARFNQNR